MHGWNTPNILLKTTQKQPNGGDQPSKELHSVVLCFSAIHTAALQVLTFCDLGVLPSYLLVASPYIIVALFDVNK